jgi:hypothetical protein
MNGRQAGNIPSWRDAAPILMLRSPTGQFVQNLTRKASKIAGAFMCRISGLYFNGLLPMR